MLGVARNADQKAIKDAFRDLALKYHPDRNKEPGAEARFKEIAEAYTVLSDPKKRSDYDSRGFAGVSGFSRDDLFGGINFDDIFSGMNAGFGMGASGNPFEGFFRRERHGPSKGADMEVVLSVPLERIARGGEERFQLTRPITCPACHGTGEKDGAPPPRCRTCNGMGRVSRGQRQGANHVVIEQIEVCPECHGRGFVIEHPCPECHGTGEKEQIEDLSVKIPFGIEDGMALRIHGKGMPAPEPSGAPGDLFVVIHTQPDLRFERSGADLIRQESIPLVDAVLGTTLTVPTLDGTASVTVEPGTQPDSVLRLKGKGLPFYNGTHNGDLFVRIGIKVPETLTGKERDLYEQLRSSGGGKPAQGGNTQWIF